jgi:hypothetical protein
VIVQEHQTMTKPLETIDIPQADRIWDIPRVLEAVTQGNTSTTSIAAYLDKGPRQGHYYSQAAQILNWVVRDKHTGEVSLTAKGRGFLNADIQSKQRILRDLMINTEPMRSIIIQLRQSNGLSTKDIASIIQGSATLSDSTAFRRAQTVSAWLKDLGLASKGQGLQQSLLIPISQAYSAWTADTK